MTSNNHRYSVARLIEDQKLFVGDGYRAKNSEFGETGIPFLRVANISDNGFDFQSTDLFPVEDLRKVGNKISRAGDVVFTSKGTVGRLAYVKTTTPKFVYSPQLCFWRSLDESLIEPRYLYYWMQSEEFTHQANGVKGQTDMADYVSLSDQRRFFISLPPLDRQCEIANVLSLLDDKIALNRQMNQTLEAMARAIFQSWFIDFDPVRSKAAGQETSLPAEIAGLFPDGFEESPLGEIPKGWKVARIGSVCEFFYGKALKEENRIPGDIPVYGSNGQVGWHNESIVTGPGIVVGRKGNPGIVKWVQTDFFPIDTTFYVNPGNSVNMHYLYFALLLANLQNQGGDSAVPGLNRTIAYQSQVVLPQRDLIDAFQNLVTPFFESVHHNICEARTLSELRDSLLPKLMSGELQVAQSLTP